MATSSETGAGNDIEITNTNADFDALSTVANAGGAGGMSIAAEDQSTDALIRVDGIDATSADNTFEDVIQGSTITVEGESQNGETATMRIAEDNSAVRKTSTGLLRRITMSWDYWVKPVPKVRSSKVMRPYVVSRIKCVASSVKKRVA